MINGKMASTKNCVICFKEKPRSFGGHVHKGDRKIIAAFCMEHDHEPMDPAMAGHKGCFGEYKEEMGIDETFGQVGYIEA